MDTREQLEHDIEALRQSIRLHWRDLSQLALGPDERAEVRREVEQCIQDLKELLVRLDVRRQSS
ncbi:hypothetical protein A33M_2740 [Rhodovulum sp. PH10]|uniref:hypothetical protein n=1 Tax=Rhodovulum sp. PH10 TaxID=1187851 RepID=UPI00027C2663|nr:hypothetical protein [Rhodovulum sp. PH10]EJW11835.1 hypothetical protein A33M_2740 [Rhodovulum sp. PH10]